jgi:hypothetical protein
MAYDKTRQYSPSDIKFIFGGVEITGLADGTFLGLEFGSDRFMKTVGADGSVVRTRSADESAVITLTLLQSSISNDILNAFDAADFEGLTGALPMIIKDANGNSLYTADKCWISKRPSVEFGKELGTRAWEFTVDHVFAITGSSNQL